MTPGRELTHQGTVGAGAHKEEVARCVGPGVDRVAGRLESQKHLVALLGGDRLLHLIHDQHQIGAGLIHQLGEGLRQSGAPVFPELGQLKPEPEARRPEIKPLDPAPTLQQR
jgi:hypothetical protein